METPAPVNVEPKKSNTGLIIGIVVVVLLCCCCLLIAVGAYVARTQYGNSLSGFDTTFSTPDAGSLSSNGSVPGLNTTTNLPGIPSGGKANDVQRSTAWGYVVVAAATDGCSSSPKADTTTIKVTQDADSSGVWKEEWTVACDDGSKKPYTVTYSPGSGGNTDIKVAAGG